MAWVGRASTFQSKGAEALKIIDGRRSPKIVHDIVEPSVSVYAHTGTRAHTCVSSLLGNLEDLKQRKMNKATETHKYTQLTDKHNLPGALWSMTLTVSGQRSTPVTSPALHTHTHTHTHRCAQRRAVGSRSRDRAGRG